MVGSPLQKLSQLPMCRGLSETEARALLEIAEETTARAGQALFKEGDPGDALYVVLEGHLEIQKADRNGTAQLLARLGDGSVVGEMSLVQGTAPRSATALAQTEVKLLRIPAGKFEHLVRRDNLAALKVIHNLAQVLARRLLLMDEKLVDLVDKGKKKEELANFQRILTNWSF